MEGTTRKLDNALGIFAPATERRMIMTCRQCKCINVCMAQADGLGQAFDPNYDGEHGCTDFAPFTNADRIRAMSDFELAKEIENAQSGIEIKNPKNIDYFDCILEWLQQPAEDEP